MVVRVAKDCSCSWEQNIHLLIMFLKFIVQHFDCSGKNIVMT
jgi:hypothetical protein